MVTLAHGQWHSGPHLWYLSSQACVRRPTAYGAELTVMTAGGRDRQSHQPLVFTEVKNAPGRLGREVQALAAISALHSRDLSLNLSARVYQACVTVRGLSEGPGGRSW